MRRKDREMPAKFGWELADRCEYASVSMIDPDGCPYIAVLSLVRSENSLYFHCAAEGKKVDSLRKNPRVCVSFVGETCLVADKFTTKYQSAIMLGTAAEVTSRKEKIEALRLLCLKLAPSNMAAFDNAIERSLHRTAIWRIDVDFVSAKENK